MKWAVGLTTVPKRRDNLLAETLFSLATGGFDRLRLFVDGSPEGYEDIGLPITFRVPHVGPYANFMLSLAELYVREPLSDLFAVFQDDLTCSKHLRPYLERTCDPKAKVYYNLYTFPSNQSLARGRVGWYESNQFGRGAVGLVFSRECVITLLSSRFMIERPLDPTMGWRKTDGGIVTALGREWWKEMVHNPSLLQHKGTVSSFDKNKTSHGKDIRWLEYRWPTSTLATSFRGEDFDCLSLLEK